MSIYWSFSLPEYFLQRGDQYQSFEELSRNESGYHVHCEMRGPSPIIIAPHGGGIEPGTGELALAIAGGDLSYYVFEGAKPRNNRSLHITSTLFDEPTLMKALRNSRTAITLHGCKVKRPAKIVYVGGRNRMLRSRIIAALGRGGFYAVRDDYTRGLSPDNICNMGKGKRGVQLEITNTLRASFFHDLTRQGRKSTTPDFHKFASIIRGVILRTYRI